MTYLLTVELQNELSHYLNKKELENIIDIDLSFRNINQDMKYSICALNKRQTVGIFEKDMLINKIYGDDYRLKFISSKNTLELIKNKYLGVYPKYDKTNLCVYIHFDSECDKNGVSFKMWEH
jgi:hypothetical protein